VRRASPAVLEAAVSPVRAWQEDVRSAAWRMALPWPGDLLPALHVGVLLEPIDLAALIGLPGPASSPEGPLAAPAPNHSELRSVPRSPQSPPSPPSPRLPPRRAAPPPAAPLPADAGAPARRSGWRPERWPTSPERHQAPVLPAAPGAGAARLAAVLQRYEAQEAVASVSAAVDSFTARALPGVSSPRSDRSRTEPSPRKTASPASARRSRVLVALPARSTMPRGRLDADKRGRTALASMEDAVAGRLRSWSQGIDVPPPPDPARSAADAARPAGPPAARPPSPGYRGTQGGALGRAGPTSAGRRQGPTAEVPASPQLAKLTDLVEQAVGDLAAVGRRLAELGAQEGPQVQWLEDDELAGRLQGILARQARQRGIDLS